MKLLLTQIVVGERQRVDLGDLTDLAASMQELGQINAITVERLLDGTYNLVTGRRRLEAARLLGWNDIVAVEHGSLDDLAKQRIEFDEDVRRKDRTWQEKAVAVAKLHRMFTTEKNAQGESWTIRNMATFTGMPKSSVHEFLTIAEALTQQPRDEALWSCDGYKEAYKLLVEREFKKANDELERRRQLQNAAIATENTLPYLSDEDEETPSGLVREADPTEEGESHLVVYLQGRNIAFNDDKEERLPCHAAIVYLREDEFISYNKLMSLVKSEGFAIVWGEMVPSYDSGTLAPSAKPYSSPSHALIWNKIQVGPTVWPYANNYITGWLLAHNAPTTPYNEPSGSVISANQDNALTLPDAVIDFSLSWCPPNVAVLLPCNANVLAVAQSGRVPVWYEADPERFKAQCDELKRWYEETIPGVEVRMP